MDKLIPTTDPNYYLWLLLGTTKRLMTKARQKELSRHHITTRRSYVLYIINYLGEKATLSQISKYSFREVHTIFGILSRMEKDGLIKKIRAMPKSRRIRFEITDKGFRAYDISRKRKAINTIMSVLSEEERQQLSSILDKLIVKAQEV